MDDTDQDPDGARDDGEGTPRELRDRFVGPRDVTDWRSRGGRRLADGFHRASGRIGTRRTVLATLAIGGGVAGVFAYGASLVYDAVADRNGIAALDEPMLRAAMRIRTPLLDAAAAGIAEVFGPVGMPTIAITVAGLLARRRRSATPLAVIGAAGLGSLIMTISGKDIVHRHRPPLRDAIPPFEHSPSFPSGHTLNATVVAGAIAYLLVLPQRRNGTQVATVAAAGATAAAVGLSRVLLGAHWFTDVVVGWVLGGGWLSIVITVHRLVLTERRTA